ncbi:MAG: hypothetical protein FJX47_11370 [Alphaproteobacteria bacterium]|nr:hypothetical protein [Alphaproteobacteria bacterium]
MAARSTASKLAASVLFAFAFAISTSAQAWEREGLLPAPDAEGTYRVITRDPATTTSDCIGRPVTPLCAVETFIACRTREDFELCKAVIEGAANIELSSRDFFLELGDDLGSFKAHFFAGGGRDEFSVVESRLVLSIEDVETQVFRDRKTGDIVVDLFRRSCGSEERQCQTDWRNHVSYTLRRTSRGWQVEFWIDRGRDRLGPYRPSVATRVLSRHTPPAATNCVDTAMTPQCAVGHFLACFSGHVSIGCAVITDVNRRPRRLGTSYSRRLEFAIHSTREFTNPARMGLGNRVIDPWPSGDARLVDVVQRDCEDRPQPCDKDFDLKSYVVEPAGGQWFVTRHNWFQVGAD